MPRNSSAPGAAKPASVIPIRRDSRGKGKKKPNQTRRAHRLPALLLTLALLVLAVALVAFRDRLNVDALRRWISYRSISTDVDGQAEPFLHAGGDRLSFAYLNSGIVLSSATGSHYYSFTGQQVAEEVLSMTNPTLETSSSAAVVFDAGGDAIFVYRNGEEDLSYAPEGVTGSILSARINADGWLTVTARQSGYKSAVTVYNSQGEGVIRISLSSAFAVDAVLSPDCRTVAVVTIGQEGGEFFSRLVFYSVHATEPKAQVELGNTAVLDLDYESGQVWVLGEGQLLTVTPDGETVNRWSFGRDYLKGCDLGPDGYALVLLGRYRMGSAQRAVTVSAQGEELGTLPLKGQVLSYGGAGRYCALLTGAQLTICDRTLKQYKVCQDTNGARYTALAKDGSALLADSQRAWLYIPD